MRRPPIVSYTMYALEATEYAKEQGAFDPFHKELYRTYWEDGKDLGDLEVIGDVAGTCGLDRRELLDRLESGHYQGQVMSEFHNATDLGIRGIPAFLIDRYLLTGARPYETFQAVMEKVLTEGTA